MPEIFVSPSGPQARIAPGVLVTLRVAGRFGEIRNHVHVDTASPRAVLDAVKILEDWLDRTLHGRGHPDMIAEVAKILGGADA